MSLLRKTLHTWTIANANPLRCSAIYHTSCMATLSRCFKIELCCSITFRAHFCAGSIGTLVKRATSPSKVHGMRVMLWAPSNFENENKYSKAEKGEVKHNFCVNKSQLFPVWSQAMILPYQTFKYISQWQQKQCVIIAFYGFFITVHEDPIKLIGCNTSRLSFKTNQGDGTLRLINLEIPVLVLSLKSSNVEIC